MENKCNLPEDKLNKFKQLEKKYTKKGAWTAVKHFSFFILLTFLSLLVNVCVFTKPNIKFAFVCGLLNGFVFLKGLKNDLDLQNEEIKEDVKKLFEE
jgi:hypothetical protein